MSSEFLSPSRQGTSPGLTDLQAFVILWSAWNSPRTSTTSYLFHLSADMACITQRPKGHNKADWGGCPVPLFESQQ